MLPPEPRPPPSERGHLQDKASPSTGTLQPAFASAPGHSLPLTRAAQGTAAHRSGAVFAFLALGAGAVCLPRARGGAGSWRRLTGGGGCSLPALSGSNSATPSRLALPRAAAVRCPGTRGPGIGQTRVHVGSAAGLFSWPGGQSGPSQSVSTLGRCGK